jgi:hypothetical protein
MRGLRTAQALAQLTDRIAPLRPAIRDKTVRRCRRALAGRSRRDVAKCLRREPAPLRYRQRLRRLRRHWR